MLRSLIAPYSPLSSNAIASITKQGLKDMGINTEIWKPHSTRGASLGMYKALGLYSEDVCEVGKWKNVQAFTSHYLRLGASAKAGERVTSLVH